MANPPSSDQPRRRFAPVPIETTFESVRKPTNIPRQRPDQQIGPRPELTPEASPRSPSPVPLELRERRRFAPQLIETSRRTRRVGDVQPATKPADKTDITPWTKHIYSARPKHRRRQDEGPDDEQWHNPPTRRESEDENVKAYLLELAAKEAERQIEEAALAAFPNSRAREGGVAHFYFREGSGSDESPESTPVQRTRNRRKSSDLGLGWWHQHMQEHVGQLAPEHGVDEMVIEDQPIERSDSDLDMMDLSVPPDAIWTTSRKVSVDGKDANAGPLLGSLLPKPYETTTSSSKTPREPWAPVEARPQAAQTPAEMGFSRAFGGFGLKPDESKLKKLRQLASPPMLGDELKFRLCPSPKLTKLEPDHPFIQPEEEEKHRDTSGQGGLWRGYCFRTESENDYIVPAHMQLPPMLATPLAPSTPMESEHGYFPQISEEPASVQSSSGSSGNATASVATGEHRHRNGQPKGLHMLHGLDDRLRREKLQAEKDERIAQEFDDHFVTQVYNYLSLGYPATARDFDDELSKISRVGVVELAMDDQKQMAKGHMLEMNLEETVEEDRCPRWKALRIYITEWARQHGDLDNLDSLAWGVRERRGSWAI